MPGSTPKSSTAAMAADPKTRRSDSGEDGETQITQRDRRSLLVAVRRCRHERRSRAARAPAREVDGEARGGAWCGKSLHEQTEVEQVGHHQVVGAERRRPDFEIPVAVRHHAEQYVNEPEERPVTRLQRLERG